MSAAPSVVQVACERLGMAAHQAICWPHPAWLLTTRVTRYGTTLDAELEVREGPRDRAWVHLFVDPAGRCDLRIVPVQTPITSERVAAAMRAAWLQLHLPIDELPDTLSACPKQVQR